MQEGLDNAPGRRAPLIAEIRSWVGGADVSGGGHEFALPATIDIYLGALSQLLAQDRKSSLQELPVNSKERPTELRTPVSRRITGPSFWQRANRDALWLAHVAPMRSDPTRCPQTSYTR